MSEQEQSGEQQQQLWIRIIIDADLGLSTEVAVPGGSTVSELAELLAAQDLTGSTDGGQIGFRLMGSTCSLGRDERLSELSGLQHSALELLSHSHPHGPAGHPEPLLEAAPGAVSLSQGVETSTLHLGDPGQKAASGPRGLYIISDTHCEARPNMAWLKELPSFPGDTLILAGDVAVEMGQLEEALRLFTSRFKHVFYCFGNHECWTSKHKFADSFAKIEAIHSLCETLGVHTRPQLVEDTWIVPIIGWYHETWDSEPPLSAPPGEKLKVEPRSARAMSNDYVYCRWPGFEHGSEELAARLDQENEAWGTFPLPAELLEDAAVPPGQRRRRIVSFSHFLPRLELFFEKRLSMEPNLAKLIGSSWIRGRIDQLQPDIHVFGHTHVCWDMLLEGVRYISWPLGMPEERFWRRCAFPQSSDCGLPLRLLDTEGYMARPEAVCFGSRIYSLLERDPSSHIMYSRVANKFCPQAPVLFDDVCMPGRTFSWDLPEDPALRQFISDNAKTAAEFKRKRPDQNPRWWVVGGEDRGGILVREGAGLESAKCPERLSCGALVEELVRKGDRLMYRRLAGTGPEMGWVAIALPEKELLVPEKMPPKPGELKLEDVLQLQEALIRRLRAPAIQQALRDLFTTYKGKQRTVEPFVERRRSILQAEFDRVLPSYGFPEGNLMQLDVVIADFYDVNKGNERVKRNKRVLDQLMFLNVRDLDGPDALIGA